MPEKAQYRTEGPSAATGSKARPRRNGTYDPILQRLVGDLLPSPENDQLYRPLDPTDGGVRVVPMFPELVPHFQRVFNEADEGSVHIITRYRNPAANLRTQFGRYIVAAGLTPWPKPWVNLRASRATDLANEFPSHVACAWLGHTEAIADSFYRQVTPDHYAKATQGPTKKAAQKAAQYPHAPARKSTTPTSTHASIVAISDPLQLVATVSQMRY